MSYRDMPDCKVPPSHLRCEALTRPGQGWQDWQRLPHRCVRKAVQGRDGRSVCALHARVREVIYWQGEPDNFRHKAFWRWPRSLQKMLGLVR